jgi:methyl-accepting chemotaxis protein
MVEAARRIEAEDLTKRIPAQSSDDELGRLAAVLNDMLARLGARLALCDDSVPTRPMECGRPDDS